MNICDIELIEAGHRTGSLSKAHIELSISHVTLSKRLVRLERNLRPKLFFAIQLALSPPPWLTVCLHNRIERDLDHAISSARGVDDLTGVG